MADKGIKVHIYGDYDDKDVKKAIKDLRSLQGQAGPTEKGVASLSKSFLGMGAAVAGAFAIGNVISFGKEFATQAISMAQESQKTTDRIEAIAKSMGVFDSQLGGTTKRLTDYAQELQNATGISDETTKSGQAILLTFSEIANTAGEAGGMFDRATAALLDLSAAGFGDATTNAKSLGKALNDPLKGLTALGRQGITFTQQEKDKVKALVETNQTLAAQELIMAAVEKQVGGTAAAVATDFDKIKAAADDAQEIIGFALVDSIGKVVTSIGGVDDVNLAMTNMGESIAGMVETAGTMLADVAGIVGGLARWAAETDNLDDTTKKADYTLSGFLQLIPVAGSYLAIWARDAADANLEQENLTESIAASESYWKSYIASLDGAAAEERQVAADAQTAEEALNDLKDAAKSLRDTISDSQSLDDYRRKLMDLSETLKGNARNFSNASEAGRENRDTLRELFSDAAVQAERWAERTGASVDEFEAKFDGKAVKIIDAFVAQGFDRADVEDFLNKQGIWTSELRRLQATVTDESEKLGFQIPRGISVGVKRGEDALRSTVSGTVLSAIQAGKNAAKIQSPSQVTRDEIGIPLIDGIIAGLDSKKEELKAKAADNAQAVIDGARDRLTQWDETIAAYKDRYDELADYARGLSSSLFGQLDLGAAVDSAKETGGSVVDAFVEQGKAIGTFSQSMIDLLNTGLSQTAWEAVNALGAARGQQLADEMLGAQGATTIAGINQVYADVEHMANAVGELAAQKWYGEGVAQAQATYEGFKANFGEGGPARKALENLMDRLASAMNRTATITVTTVNRTVNEVIGRYGGERAMGGPVAASTAYLVGERGPELFIPNSAGQIIPNGDLPMASGGVMGGDGASLGGNSYTINVQAGVGDPRQIGQQVVEYIRRFESANGRVFAAA